MTVEQVIGKAFGLDPADVNESTSRQTVEQWDSMGHLTLILELETHYNVTISIADAMDMVDVKAIKGILGKYGVSARSEAR
jgi:acyl carrier protein